MMMLFLICPAGLPGIPAGLPSVYNAIVSSYFSTVNMRVLIAIFAVFYEKQIDYPLFY